MRRTSYFYFITFILTALLCSHKTNAYVFSRFTTRDGLASNTVYSSFCDSKGYVWFCTDRGLSRFDGLHFKNYTIGDGMADNEVFNLFEDSKHRLWLFTYNGEPCFYRNGKFYNRQNDDLLAKMPDLPYINAMYETSGDLYVGYIDGQVLKIADGNIKWLRKTANKYSKVSAITKYGHQLIIVRTGFLEYMTGDSIVGRHTDSIYFANASENKLAVATPSGIWLYTHGAVTKKYYEPRLNATTVLRFHRAADHKTYCATKNGLAILNELTGHVAWLLKDLTITSIFQYGDEYWVSSLQNGVYYFNEGLMHMKRLSYKHTRQAEYKGDEVFFKKDSAIYYLSMDSGIFQVKQIHSRFPYGIRPLYLDREIFVASDMDNIDCCYSLYLHNLRNKVTAKYSLPLSLKTVYRLQDDTFLIIALEKILRVRIQSNSLRIIDTLFAGDRILQTNLNADHSELHFNTGKTLYEYSFKKDKLNILDSHLKGGKVESIYSQGSLVVLCTNDRMFLYDKAVRHRYSIKIGDFTIYEIQSLGDRQYILNSSKGYLLYSLHNFFSSYPVPVTYPFQRSHLQWLRIYGDVALAKVQDQYINFPARVLNSKPTKSRLYIVGATANGQMYTSNELSVNNSVKCNLKIFLNAVTTDKNAIYQYRVYDGNWGLWYSTKAYDLNILLNRPGFYTVEVRLIGSDKTISPSSFLFLTIKPPFFHSTSFYVLLGLIMIVLVGMSARFYLKKKKKAFESELYYLQMEHKAINALLNPHFIFNVVNNVQNLINSGSKEEANTYLATMSKMIRQNLENLQFTLIQLNKELELIQNYIRLQNLRYRNRIELNIVDETGTRENVFIPPLLIHSFIENSIIHGMSEEGVLNIELLLEIVEKNYLMITILDNGKGLKDRIASPKGKSSLGIEFNYRRLRRLSEYHRVQFTMNVDNRSDGRTGTEVIVLVYANFCLD